MFDISTFLTRWLFISNLVRDVAEIQTLPPYYSPPPQYQQQLSPEDFWRDQCLRGILSYPAGSPQRCLVMDAIRVDLVRQLSQALEQSESALRQQKQQEKVHQEKSAADEGDSVSEGSEDDPYLDTDTEIVKAFEQKGPKATTMPGGKLDSSRMNQAQRSEEEALLVIARDEEKSLSHDPYYRGDASHPIHETRQVPPPPPESTPPMSTEDAIRIRSNVREFLPQLVSAVTTSPSAVDPNLADPIKKLRQVLIDRCLADPSWGIELCWLLEAGVGRSWKTLFEHRLSSGRRLLVVLPAEKAAVVAKIGIEKQEVFDLLQDAEQATAYGYPATQPPVDEQMQSSGAPSSPPSNWHRLPSSISLRRCSHFGDTMHLVDRLTEISLNMRKVPALQRLPYLREHLHEINRRIRRRMVTRGEVSLDVEDSKGPYDWPQIQDLSEDMLQYSVHFPLVPQTVTWPTGTSSDAKQQKERYTTKGVLQSNTVVRVLNLVVDESRLLASRERCPYLIHMEVADTGLEGSDARLYASGQASAGGLGSTVEEALLMSPTRQHEQQQRNGVPDGVLPSYHIPPELLDLSTIYGGQSQSFPGADAHSEEVKQNADKNKPRNDMSFSRGGWQSDFVPDEFPLSGDNERFRQHEHEQLRQHTQVEQGTAPPRTAQPNTTERPTVSRGAALLDKVFGRRLSEKCREIREASPFGRVKGWRLASFIIKAGEDIRRESLVMQIIARLGKWFQEDIPEQHRPFMRPYTIMCVGGDAGLLECLSDVKSVDEVKKRSDGFVSLRDYFERAYGPPTRTHAPPAQTTPLRQAFLQRTPHPRRQKPDVSTDSPVSFETAQDNFLRSLVGYSLVCYILQIKDRHNANILLDREGHIIHIDFGFVLGDTPKMGKVPIFSERAPFKLSQEFWDVLGGWNLKEGGLGVRFCKMFELAFASAASHADEIANFVEAAVLTVNPNPIRARAIAAGVRNRLRLRGPPGSMEQQTFIMDIVNAALTCWGTSTYDWLQRNMNGYE